MKSTWRFSYGTILLKDRCTSGGVCVWGGALNVHLSLLFTSAPLTQDITIPFGFLILFLFYLSIFSNAGDIPWLILRPKICKSDNMYIYAGQTCIIFLFYL